MNLDFIQTGYIDLFNNTIPLLVLETDTDKIIYASKCAVEKYGWTEKEFYELKLSDISIPETDKAERSAENKLQKQRCKNNTFFWVSLIEKEIPYRGRWCRLIYVIDKTKEFELSKQNNELSEFLLELMFSQTHTMRSSLTNVISLAQIIEKNFAELLTKNEELPYCSSLLLSEAEKLDEFLKNTIYATRNAYKSAVPLGGKQSLHQIVDVEG